ncbi:thermonuclease family protein [Amylibacter sp.]|nr:thermonuclease family protein [Amylibacter sp.]MDB9918866.1 thermonuclease family protein [Amylibacter sp.]
MNLIVKIKLITFFMFVAFHAFANNNIKTLQLSKSSILTGIITHVRDGDTIIIGAIPIRLAALDCPEKNTDKGKYATEIAVQFVGEIANCELTGAKTYDRFVGYCSINGDDFGQFMMQNSSCKVWKKFDIMKKY